MNASKFWTGLCAALLLLATLGSGTSLAQDPKNPDPKDRDAKVQDAKMIEGTLMDMNQTAKTLTVKVGDNEIQFSFTDQTELVVPDNGGAAPIVAKGTKMRVHYTEREKAKIATKIEIIEATAAR
jgi:hypothetical protein